MPSPFPGMDPYLEAQPFWSDLQGSLLSVIKQELQKSLPAQYSVWSDIYIWLHEPAAETRRGKPDDFITTEPVHEAGGGLATLSAPTTTVLPAVRREGNKYLKIKEVRSERVVTILEFLSPANKAPGVDRDAYLAKRNEYLATKTNVVEIDLHRTGRRMPIGKPTPRRADYYVLICRAADFPRTGIWPFTVREPLPEIPIPLKPEDGVVMLALQPCFAAAYEQGPYRKDVDYAQPPRIPLKGKDAVWAKQEVQRYVKQAKI